MKLQIRSARKILGRHKKYIIADEVTRAKYVYALLKSVQTIMNVKSIDDISQKEVIFCTKMIIINPMKNLLPMNIFASLCSAIEDKKLYSVIVNKFSLYRYELSSKEFKDVFDYLLFCDNNRTESLESKGKSYTKAFFSVELKKAFRSIHEDENTTVHLTRRTGYTVNWLTDFMKDSLKIKSVIPKNDNLTIDLILAHINKRTGLTHDYEEVKKLPSYLRQFYSTKSDKSVSITNEVMFMLFKVIYVYDIKTVNYAFNALFNILTGLQALALVDTLEITETQKELVNEHIRTKYMTKYKQRCCQDPNKLLSTALYYVDLRGDQ